MELGHYGPVGSKMGRLVCRSIVGEIRAFPGGLKGAVKARGGVFAKGNRE